MIEDSNGPYCLTLESWHARIQYLQFQSLARLHKFFIPLPSPLLAFESLLTWRYQHSLLARIRLPATAQRFRPVHVLEVLDSLLQLRSEMPDQTLDRPGECFT